MSILSLRKSIADLRHQLELKSIDHLEALTPTEKYNNITYQRYMDSKRDNRIKILQLEMQAIRIEIEYLEEKLHRATMDTLIRTKDTP
jgi:hypothetical protein